MPATAQHPSRRAFTISTGSWSIRKTRGRDSGRLLLGHVEQEVVKRGGRMILIETSSQETYGATIRFYKRGGYDLVARIKNFYRVGDDKLIFSKELTK